MPLHLLSGSNKINNLRLIETENDIGGGEIEPFYIKELKIQIINKLLIPISTDDLDSLVDASSNYNYLISFYKDKILELINIYNSKYDLLTYSYMLQVFSYAVYYYDLMIRSNPVKIEDKQFGKVQKHLGIIQMKAEYILYDQIIGKPNRKNKEKYKIDIIRDIKILLNGLNTDFYKIKEFILDKYK
jgi:hypothetical protein